MRISASVQLSKPDEWAVHMKCPALNLKKCEKCRFVVIFKKKSNHRCFFFTKNLNNSRKLQTDHKVAIRRHAFFGTAQHRWKWKGSEFIRWETKGREGISRSALITGLCTQGHQKVIIQSLVSLCWRLHVKWWRQVEAPSHRSPA